MLQVYFVLSVLYWLLSASQYHKGYPLRTEGQLLTRSNHWYDNIDGGCLISYRVIGYLFMLYRAIPFIFEIRTLLDWICTETVLFLYEVRWV